MKVGFIGLGLMGSRMAANLQNAGYELVLHNRTPAKADPLLVNGAIWGDTPAAVGRQAEILITMLAHPAAVTACAQGEDGFLDALPAGSLWIDCSTTNPTFSREMAAAAARREIRFLDAPVAGTTPQAEAGQLRFIVGGTVDDVATATPLFDVMGSQVVHVGAQGMGISLKLVVNYMLGTTMTAFAEAMSLGQALGLSRKQLLNVLVGSPVAPPFLAGKRSKIEHGDYDPQFPLQWLRKDLHMAATAAYDNGAALPLGNAAKEIMQLAVQQGLGELDFAVLYQFYAGDE